MTKRQQAGVRMEVNCTVVLKSRIALGRSGRKKRFVLVFRLTSLPDVTLADVWTVSSSFKGCVGSARIALYSAVPSARSEQVNIHWPSQLTGSPCNFAELGCVGLLQTARKQRLLWVTIDSVVVWSSRLTLKDFSFLKKTAADLSSSVESKNFRPNPACHPVLYPSTCTLQFVFYTESPDMFQLTP